MLHCSHQQQQQQQQQFQHTLLTAIMLASLAASSAIVRSEMRAATQERTGFLENYLLSTLAQDIALHKARIIRLQLL